MDARNAAMSIQLRAAGDGTRAALATAMTTLRSVSIRLLVALGLVGLALAATGCPKVEPCILYCD